MVVDARGGPGRPVRVPAVPRPSARAASTTGRMAMDASPHRHGSGLTGRRAECGVLDRLIEAVRAWREPGPGGAR